jgi:hypothetical protein
VALSAGSTLGPGQLSAADLTYSAPSLREGTELDIALTDTDGSVVSSVFVLPNGGLEEDRWLRSDGSFSSTPCAAPS